MIIAGIDSGAQTTKVVLTKDGRVLARALRRTGFNQNESAEQALEQALNEAGLKRADVACIVATGVGRNAIEFADMRVTEISAAGRGANAVWPAARTVIDVGAEEGRAVSIDERGKVLEAVTNEKCAAGAGSFVEAMARALEVSVDELVELALKASKVVPMNAQCVVFAESEVVSLIHSRVPKEDISGSIHEAIASRISSMTRRVNIAPDVVFIGGLAKNAAVRKYLEKLLEREIHVPENPEYVDALGAALCGREN